MCRCKSPPLANTGWIVVSVFTKTVRWYDTGMINSFIPATELEQPIRAHLWCYPLCICGWISLTLFFIIQSICRIVSIFVGWQCLKPTTILVLHSRVSHGRLLPQTKVALWNFRQGIKHFEVSKFKPLWKFTCSLSRTETSFSGSC